MKPTNGQGAPLDYTSQPPTAGTAVLETVPAGTGTQDVKTALTAFAAWRAQHLRGDEKGEAQIFLNRLFQAFGHDGLREAGATLEERIKKRDHKGTSFADLMWKPRVLIEMKKAGTDLSRHYRQALGYWIDAVPNRPRYVILCNFDEFWIYDFDSQLDAPVDKVKLTELAIRVDALAFLLPTPAEPVFGNDLVRVTRHAAALVAEVFRSIHERGVDRRMSQRFVLQCVVAMFAEDIGLLPSKVFSRALKDAKTGAEAYDLLLSLFTAMNTPGFTAGGRFASTPYFNGGLFAVIGAVELTRDELAKLRFAAETDWSGVRPEIFGTLFEGSMDAGQRHALGAHFTSQVDIAKVVLPTIVNPWQERINAARTIADFEGILGDMSTFKVLDPACGSGNFLYVAYREMRRLEAHVKDLVAERRGSAGRRGQLSLSYVPADHFFGIDVNEFAVEVAKVTMMLATKLASDELDDEQPVLPLDNLDGVIMQGDALFQPWPPADAIIGNPPYLGRRKMAEELGADYNRALRMRHPKVGGVSDFVCYWFPLAHNALPDGGRAGFVATQGIRNASSRVASLDYVVGHDGVITDAVSVQPWSGDAVVHVSIVNWVKGSRHAPEKKVLWLDQGNRRIEVAAIAPTLRTSTDVSAASALSKNRSPKTCFQGQTSGMIDTFRLTPDQARAFIAMDPGAREVIHPILGGATMLRDVAPHSWIIDLPQEDALDAEIVSPSVMRYLRENVLPERKKKAQAESKTNTKSLDANPNAKVATHNQNFLRKWWQHAYRRADMVRAISQLPRYIALSRVAAEDRLSIFHFVDASIRPDDSMAVLALDDDYSLGVVSSSLHREWFDERCSRMKVDPRYTSTTVWDSFPWPADPDPAHVAKVADITSQIVSLREQYLGRGVTLARMYDSLREPGSSILRTLHERLDAAVLALYQVGPDDDTLAKLLELNQAGAANPATVGHPGGSQLSGTYTSTYKLTAPAL